MIEVIVDKFAAHGHGSFLASGILELHLPLESLRQLVDTTGLIRGFVDISLFSGAIVSHLVTVLLICQVGEDVVVVDTVRIFLH